MGMVRRESSEKREATIGIGHHAKRTALQPSPRPQNSNLPPDQVNSIKLNVVHDLLFSVWSSRRATWRWSAWSPLISQFKQFRTRRPIVWRKLLVKVHRGYSGKSFTIDGSGGTFVERSSLAMQLCRLEREVLECQERPVTVAWVKLWECGESRGTRECRDWLNKVFLFS